MRLVDAANVMTPAYLAILSKGYSVRAENGSIVAERDGHCFVADSPVPLLGLIAMTEVRGEEWQASDTDIEEFLALFG